jgi:hypothetical protein
MDGGGRGFALAWAAVFLAGGGMLLARQLGWLDLDFGLLAALGLLAIGALILVGALTPRWWSRGHADAEEDCDPRWGWSGRYWMVVTAGFFLLMALNLGGRSLGVASPGWAVSGPYWLAAIGGMFLVRALAPRRANDA